MSDTVNQAVIPFDQADNVPAYMQELMGQPSLADTFGATVTGNRITLRNGRFRMIVGGQEVEESTGPLDVIIHGFSPYASRQYYEGAYNPQDKPTGPDCFSEDGETPSKYATKVQAQMCQMCPQNTKDMNGRKACKSFKRIVVSLVSDRDVTLYQLDVASMSMWGDDNQAQSLYNLRNYGQVLHRRGVPAQAVVTRLSVDSGASVSKMFFTPVGYLDERVYNFVQQNVDKPLIEESLATDIRAFNERKTGGAQQVTQATQAQIEQTTQAAPAPEPAPVQQAAPAPEPAPVAQPAEPAASPATAESSADVGSLDDLLGSLT